MSDDETTAATTDDAGSSPEPDQPGADQPGTVRGSILLFAVAFILVLVAVGGVATSARGFLTSLTPLWISVAASVGAVLVSIAAVTVRRRP